MLSLNDFAENIRRTDGVVVFTGAGISTESGIPDFRSPGGIWTRYRPVTYQEYLSSEAARIEAWHSPKEVIQKDLLLGNAKDMPRKKSAFYV